MICAEHQKELHDCMCPREEKPMIDPSCRGAGATHNACSCVLERMAKLEKVRAAAEYALGMMNGSDANRHLADALAATEPGVKS